MWESELEQKIRNLLEQQLASLGKEIVLVSFNDKSKVLEILIEKENYGKVTLDDCEEASRLISTILDVEDPIESNYYLQIGSPGVERPLSRKKDYQKFQGKKIKVWLKQPILDTNRKLIGVIEASNEEYITLLTQTDMGKVNIPYQAIKRSELIFEEISKVFNQHNRNKKASRENNLQKQFKEQ